MSRLCRHTCCEFVSVFYDFFFFFKQKTAYVMRISDWSSDVCSSDLRAVGLVLVLRDREPGRGLRGLDLAEDRVRVGADVGDAAAHAPGREIGRESCRERVCQYV